VVLWPPRFGERREDELLQNRLAWHRPREDNRFGDRGRILQILIVGQRASLLAEAVKKVCPHATGDHRRPLRSLWHVIPLLVVVLSACGASPPDLSSTEIGVVLPAAPTEKVLPGLPGLGALDEDRNHSHRADPSKPPGSTYVKSEHDIGPYTGVVRRVSRIFRYSIDVSHEPMTALQAKNVAATELPADADLRAGHVYSACERLLYWSATMGYVLNYTPVPDPFGLAGVTFRSGTKNYDATHITAITLELAPPNFVEQGC